MYEVLLLKLNFSNSFIRKSRKTDKTLFLKCQMVWSFDLIYKKKKRHKNLEFSSINVVVFF